MRSNFLRGLLLFIAGALSATAVGIAIGAELNTANIRETSVSGETPIIGLRPTGVGLPEIGIEGTVGAGELAGELQRYHDSGEYRHDLEAVASRAERFLVKRVNGLRTAARRRCSAANRRGVNGSALTRACREPRPAMVLDIDETSLSNYGPLQATGFLAATPALLLSAALANAPAIAATHDIYERALALKVAVFFITGRPESIPQARERTVENLAAAGYGQYRELILNDTGQETIPYKSGKRAEIERRGYDIVVNMGDQESDLAGGHADRAFKLPNPFYFIG